MVTNRFPGIFLTSILSAVQSVSGAVLNVLLPILKEMNANLKNLKELYGNISDTVINLEETVSDLNETVVYLDETVEERKSQTSSELATAVLVKLLPYLNDMEDDLSERIYETVEKQTETLANLHENTDDSMNKLTWNLQGSLSMINESIIDLRDKVCNISDTVSNMNETVSNLEETVEEHKRQTKSVLADLQEKVNESAKGLAEDIHDWMSSINGTVTDVRVKVCDSIWDLKNLTTSQLHSWDLSNELQCIKNELKQISNHLDGKNKSSCYPSTVEPSMPTVGVSPSSVEPSPSPAAPIPTYACGGEGGWRRVVYLNMTDPNTNCPSGWNHTEYSNRIYCGRSSSGQSCDSVFFPVYGGDYTRVCGAIRAYQFDYTEAFEDFNRGSVTTIDDVYVDGVSLTHGTPRQHIWTFAAGLVEYQDIDDACPCDVNIDIAIPTFVGNDYFCESGVNSGLPDGFQPDDPLWDGQGCTSTSACCSLNNPPYFTKQLSRPTTDDIEARICQQDEDGDTPIELIELYVQ